MVGKNGDLGASATAKIVARNGPPAKVKLIIRILLWSTGKCVVDSYHAATILYRYNMYKIDPKILSRDIPISTYDIMFASVQEFVNNIRKGVREVSSPTSQKSSPPKSHPPESDTSTCNDATRAATRNDANKQAYYQRLVLDDIHHSLSRHTRYRNIGDDMNETWIFENPSVNLGASNCHTCGEYIMTSNYDFYVDTLPHKCMCKCEH